MNKEKMNITIDKASKDFIKQYADSKGVSASFILNRYIRKLKAKEREKRYNRIKQQNN